MAGQPASAQSQSQSLSGESLGRRSVSIAENRKDLIEISETDAAPGKRE
jgi:hypothetical protein